MADPRAQSWANGINDFSQVVGSANTVYVGLDFHAYLYSNNGMENIDPDEQSEALAINNHGAVIGNERDGRIFLYSGGMIERLDIFGAALDINDRVNSSAGVHGVMARREHFSIGKARSFPSEILAKQEILNLLPSMRVVRLWATVTLASSSVRGVLVILIMLFYTTTG